MTRKTVKKYTLKKPSDRVLKEIQRDHFRVAIFGSARIKKGDKNYKQVYDLAKMIGEQNIDIVTGGGTGLMEAANRGHKAGSKNNPSHSFGLLIDLPTEQSGNHSLDIKKEFKTFTARLDSFMALSNVVVVAPGGIGTTLELFYTWQLIQVKHVCEMPVILLGPMWKALLKWVQRWPLKEGFMSSKDMKVMCSVNKNKKALEIITKAHGHYLRGSQTCINLDKYLIYKEKKKRKNKK